MTREPFRHIASATRRFPHVLIVEAEVSVAALIRAVVLRHGHGCSATVVYDGAEAIAYFGGEGRFADREIYPLPDLVILDLGLPGIDGYEVLAWMDGRPECADSPVVVVSAAAEQEAARRAYDLGARGFVPRSADPSRLAAVVRATLLRWGPERARERSAG